MSQMSREYGRFRKVLTLSAYSLNEQTFRRSLFGTGRNGANSEKMFSAKLECQVVRNYSIFWKGQASVS